MKKMHFLKSKRLVAFLFIAYAVLLCVLTACSNERKDSSMSTNNTDMRFDVLYAIQFGMDGSEHLLQASTNISQSADYYDEIIFTAEQTSATQNSGNVLYIYPTDITSTYLSNLNGVLNMHGHDITSYDLSLPITMEDILHKRHNVMDLLENYPENLHTHVFNSRDFNS